MTKQTTLDGVAKTLAFIVERMATKDDVSELILDIVGLKDEIADIHAAMVTKVDYHDLRQELHNLRADLKELRQNVENIAGFRKEIDHALERIAAIERRIDKTIPA